MQSGVFWKNWSSPYREIYLTLLIVFVAILSGVFYLNLQGIESMIGWSVIAQSEPIKILIETFKTGPFSLQTHADSQVFTQKFTGNYPEVQAWSYYLFLIVTTLCFNVLIAITTKLPKFWFFVGASLLVVVLVNLKLELLLLLGSESKIGLIIALALFLSASYIFNAIKTQASFTFRLLTFLTITAVLALFIGVFAEVNSPFLHLASYGLINPLLISLIFILLVAHEIIAAFIYLLTRSSTNIGGKSLLHFVIITTIYLVNLFLAYLHETRVIDWDFLYINLFLLLGISATIGIWGYSAREPQFESFFSFKPLGAFFYLALAVCCFVTISHFTATGNDPALEVFRDIIIYGHLGYGLIFLLYILANFVDPLKRNMQVFKVLYKPMNMPYFTFRLAGLIAFIAFTVKSNWEVPVNQGMSAYYNSLGDLHRYNNDLLLARHFYEEGAIFGHNNHKSNFELAALAHNQKKADEAIARYKTATIKNPSPQSYINLSNIYADRDEFFKGLFTLQEGSKKFPNEGHILNNLGLLYAKTNILDTAAIFIDKASKVRATQATAGSNMLSLLALNDIPVHPDSVMDEYNIEKDAISINNMLILKNKLKVPSKEGFQAKDSTLTYLQSSILYNIALNHLFQPDSINTNILQAYSIMPGNMNYRESLQFAAALNLEKNQNVNKAFRQLNWLANTSRQNGGKYFNLLGLWAMKHEVPYVAVDYFSYALRRNFESARLNLAIALTENLQIEKALSLWNELLASEDRNTQLMATNLLAILNHGADELKNDLQRYYYLRYKTTALDTVHFEQIVEGFENDNYKAHAIFDMVKKQWKKDRESSAIKYYARLADLKIADEDLYRKIQWFELKMLAAQGNIRGLAAKINQGITFDEKHLIEKHYYTALLNEASGDTTNARINYELIAYKNPFFEESIIASANYIGQQDQFEAYHILLNALESNPESVKLLKAYILQCAKIESATYAEISLETLKTLITKKEFALFKNSYHELLNKVKADAENF